MVLQETQQSLQLKCHRGYRHMPPHRQALSRFCSSSSLCQLTRYGLLEEPIIAESLIEIWWRMRCFLTYRFWNGRIDEIRPFVLCGLWWRFLEAFCNDVRGPLCDLLLRVWCEFVDDAVYGGF